MRSILFMLLLYPLLLCPLTAKTFSANVMAPLQVEDRAEFRQQLTMARQIGVEGVSVDVWWGLVEQAGDQQFNWQYYDNIFADIRGAGLKIIPIMALHQCGGNVGDDCDIPLPVWIWQHYAAQGVSSADLQYQSEFGNRSTETVSLWADQWVLAQYSEFMQAFAARYAALAPDISEINISMGPAGELRYPSYNSHDGDRTSYPSRGGFQAYSALAVADFRQAMQQKYQQISQLNLAWQSAHTDFSQLMPPANGDIFIHSGAQFNTADGRDFIRWYHNALLAHGQRMLDTAMLAFNNELANIELGFKIPGIHWKIAANDNSRRSAELAAGLIASDSTYASENGFGYSGIISLAARYAAEPRGVILHFTALEMDDNPATESQSMAKSLVAWVGAEANRQQVTIKGENALAAGVTQHHGWDNIAAVFANGHYSGMTVLRLAQVTDAGPGQQRYQRLIAKLQQKMATTPAIPQ
ncbi:family 14 glycosylhydrolase [Rheinheimera maricola]|uniref:Beta-amylase n=1 Tax=Rheinheimera maricola TaxID=2793282 RepID=A0ABS7XA09_9GAMM|nr:family 14 glycosylhydrolase [Rheinheimera maricola]MBZ9612393.1 family 14 glycosylhydrolase [Rheinheimera maricola]